VWTIFRPFFAQKTENTPEDLPLSSRVSNVEIDLLNVSADLGKLLGTIKTLQGKVYRGVQLGDTTESPEEVPAAHVEQVGFSQTKQDLYEKAARLRRH